MSWWRWLWDVLHEKGVEASVGFDDDAMDGPSISMTKELGSGYDREAEEDEQREKIIEYARVQLGVPYKLGAEVDLDDL